MIYKCFMCGKEFSFSGQKYTWKKLFRHAGKVKTVYFCGWNCMRKFEEEKEKEQWQKRK